MDNIITMKEQIQLFEGRKVRTVWDEEHLTDSANPAFHSSVIAGSTRNLFVVSNYSITLEMIFEILWQKLLKYETARPSS